jgi:hypothetical protein
MYCFFSTQAVSVGLSLVDAAGLGGRIPAALHDPEVRMRVACGARNGLSLFLSSLWKQADCALRNIQGQSRQSNRTKGPKAGAQSNTRRDRPRLEARHRGTPANSEHPKAATQQTVDGRPEGPTVAV